MLSTSIIKHDEDDDKGKNDERMLVTVLFCNAYDKCRAPSLPILFRERSSIVSVYVR